MRQALAFLYPFLAVTPAFAQAGTSSGTSIGLYAVVAVLAIGAAIWWYMNRIRGR